MKKISYALLLLAILATNAFTQTTLLDSLINKVSVDSLRLYIRQLSGDTSCVIGGSPYTIISRHKLQPGNNIAAQYIYEKFQSFGITAQYDSFSATGKNVIGTKVGTHFPNKYYIVCGHFDAMPSGTTAPGADDNASGTAAVIELARILSKYNPQYTIKFIGFDEEEQGLVGSIYYATQARNRNDSIMGVINLDMIGYDGNNDGKINVHSKNVANTVEIANDFVNNIAAHNIGLVPVIVASQPYSDHEAFLQKNYGAILVIEDNNDFNPYYHTVSDRFQYINVPYFHKMVKATMATLAKYALNLKITLEHTHSGLPAEFVLYQNYPNPFNPKTIIRYQIPEAGKVTLRVYDLLGREIAQLIDEYQVAGYKSVEFDASNFTSGVYFYKLSASPSTSSGQAFTSVKKAILMR